MSMTGADIMDDELYRLRDALDGGRGDDQRRIAVHGLMWIDTLLRKNADYGSSAWKQPVLAPDVEPATAIRVRMSDKVQRLSTLWEKGVEPEIAESIDETVKDLGAYCLLWLARPKEPTHG